jgi:tetratricopeptide (TPR) repeat protein
MMLAAIDSLITQARAESASKIIRDALPIARQKGDSSLVLALLIRRGELLACVNRAREAEPLLRDLLARAGSLRDSASVCRCLRWLGVSAEAQGRWEEARETYVTLLDLSRRLRDRNAEGWALIGLAWHAEQRGSFEEALQLYRQALDLLVKTSDPVGESWALNGLGNISMAHGEARKALEYYRQSRDRAVEVDYPMGEFRALNNIGSIEFRIGDPTEALAAFEKSRDLQIRLRNRHDAVIPAINVAVCQTYLGRYQEADSGLEKNIALCRAGGWLDLELKLKNQLGRVKAEEGAFPEAARLYRDCLSAKEALSSRTRAEISSGLSDALASMDSSAAGLTVLDCIDDKGRSTWSGDLSLLIPSARAARLLELGRPTEAIPLLRGVDAEALRLGISECRLSALAEAARAYRALAMSDSSLALLERAGRVWEAERRIPADPEWREQRGSSAQMIYTDLASELIRRPGGVARAFDRLQVFKARSLLERMRGPDPGPSESDSTMTSTTSTTDIPAITLRQLQSEVLQPGEAFLDCYVGPESSFVFAITREEIGHAVLPCERTLAARVSLYREILTTPAGDRASLLRVEMIRRTAASIDSLLFAGVEPLLRGKERIFISPDGPLHTIPFGIAGAAESGGSSGRASNRAPTWVRIPSATLLHHLRHDPRATRGIEPVRVLALHGDGGPDRASLAGACAEVERLHRKYKGVRTTLSDPGSEGWLTLQDYDLIHFASHTRILEQSPWQSEVQVGQRGEVLRAMEIGRLHLRASLAVLSSCESAQGGIRFGEGVAGLTSAFIAAGVPAVVATLWPVDDRLTAFFMDRFYSAISEGETIGTSLASAQASVREDPRTRDPFYWAGFVLVGDGRTVLPLERRTRPGPYITGGLLLLAVAGFVAVETRRRPHPRSRRDDSLSRLH